ncbi:MAG TPA: LysE family translocator [Steroidobacteraceae bacterium]|nr:LysE family translocator [Steroidobacteraceae bacterium]
MTPAAFLTISATVLVAAVTPGPAATAIVARAIADGLRPALALSAGVLTGDLLFLTLAAAGMAAAAHSMGEFFTVLRWAGAAYLAWQGVSLWRARPHAATVRASAHEGHFWRNYGAGLLLMMGHVQAILFYAALLPGVVNFAAFTTADVLVVAAMLVVIIGGVNAGWAFVGARARGFFSDERALRAVNRVAGTLMLAAAALVATRV